MSVAVKTLPLRQRVEAGGGQRLAVVFDAAQSKGLAHVNRQVAGKSERQRHPYQREALGFGAWGMARRGGWKGYRSQRPPGVITMKRGVERFATMFYGFSLTL